MRAEEWKRLVQKAAAGRTVREIRVRAGRPVFLLTDCGEQTLFSDGTLRYGNNQMASAVPVLADQALIKELMEIFSRHSLYAYEEELRQGFLTIEGGHRVGIAGKTVVLNREIHTIREISGMNIRIVHEIQGCGDFVLPFLFFNGEFLDTLILSPPGAGKTTLLRDLVRPISYLGENCWGRNVSVVDVRSELWMCVQGIAQCDLGMRTDLLDGCPKAAGISMMLRSMAPQVLAVDEIGTKEDLEAVRSGMNCGCRILATAHGASVEELRRKAYFSELIKEGLFSRYIVLCQHPAPGTVAGIYDDKLRPLFEDSGEKSGTSAGSIQEKAGAFVESYWEGQKGLAGSREAV